MKEELFLEVIKSNWKNKKKPLKILLNYYHEEIIDLKRRGFSLDLIKTFLEKKIDNKININSMRTILQNLKKEKNDRV